MAGPSFRVYVIGLVQPGRKLQTFTTFAEYRTSRGLSRIEIDKTKFNGLVKQIRGLKAFIEAGAPEFQKEQLKKLGTQLFELLFVKKTRDLFFKATGESGNHGSLPLEIIAEDPEVAGWPWEYLYNENAETFISQEFHPISRNIFTSTNPQPHGPIKGKVRMLLILGVPPEDSGTTPKEEIEYLKEVFSAHLDDNRFVMDILGPDQAQQLIPKLTNRNYDIVHYFGHAGFDYTERTGYLSIKRSGKPNFKIDADMFATALSNRGIRLVFLNACKTAVGDANENPARSSVAAALLDRGIPAVIAAQFSLPDNSAHFLAATIYNTLLRGKPVGDAIRDGRSVVKFADAAKFFDWGIPVLFSTDPGQVILPVVGKKPEWAGTHKKGLKTGDLVGAMASEKTPGAPSVVAERTRALSKDAKFKVALIDIDAKAGFLPELAEAANNKQKYYQFKVVYLPVPSGYERSDLDREVQTFLPRLAPVLKSTPQSLGVDYVCGLTRNAVAVGDTRQTDYRLFAASLPDNDRVIVVSTFKVREYAHEAGVPFAKAVLMMCLSVLVQGDERWPIERHAKTQGCLFDLCKKRRDIVVGLRKMKFDHADCRDKIGDPEQLAAIDALAELEIT